MDTAIQTPFNPAQVEIIKLFAQGLTGEQTEALRRLLISFRFSLLDSQVEQTVEKKKKSKHLHFSFPRSNCYQISISKNTFSGI